MSSPQPGGWDHVPDNIIEYVEKQDRLRAEAAKKMAGNLTERERLLVKEAAVMGYVQGYRVPDSAKDRELYPKDEAILLMCLNSARAFPDLYPTLVSLEEELASSNGQESRQRRKWWRA